MRGDTGDRVGRDYLSLPGRRLGVPESIPAPFGPRVVFLSPHLNYSLSVPVIQLLKSRRCTNRTNRAFRRPGKPPGVPLEVILKQSVGPGAAFFGTAARCGRHNPTPSCRPAGVI